MRQEVLRLLERALTASDSTTGLTDAELERLAGGWRRKYRTMRPGAAVLLFDRLREDPQPEAARFGVFVLADLERRYSESTWVDVRRTAGRILQPELRRLLARRVVAPLIARCPRILESMEAEEKAPEGSLAVLLEEAAEALRMTDPALADRVAHANAPRGQ
jgi:hypothetical protein